MVTPKETAPAPGEESLWQASVRRFGEEQAKRLLADVRLGTYIPDLPPEYARASALAFREYIWPLVARPSQLPPEGDWQVWCFIGGRGAGKSRAGSQFVISEVERAGRLIAAGKLRREEAKVLVVAPNSADLRDISVEGPAGILRSAPPWSRPSYEPSKRRLTWPNGVEAILISADDQDASRGKQGVAALLDEAAIYPNLAEVFSNVRFATRLGDRPRICLTTTPKNTKALRDILAMPGTIVSRSRTRDNVQNLAPGVVDQLYSQWGGSRLGKQELDGILLEDVVGALWTSEMIDRSRVAAAPAELRRVVTAIDPSGGSGEDNDECGILTLGMGQCSCKGGEPEEHLFVLADDSGRYSPQEWARAAVRAFEAHQGDRIVAETNFGGAMVEATLRQVAPHVPFKALTASRGKLVRAEPISAAYEAGRVHHVGHFAQLEDQMCEWSPLSSKKSPDRMDALVWAATELLDGSRSMFDANWSAENGGGLSPLVGGYTSAEMQATNRMMAGWAGAARRPGR